LHTKDHNNDKSNDCPRDGHDADRRNERNEQAEGCKPAKAKERAKPVALSILVRAETNDGDKDDRLNDHVPNDLGPGCDVTERNEPRTGYDGEDEDEPEEVVFRPIRPIKHADRVKPAVVCVERGDGRCC
jgi:hypothetical protein